jgi:hypothetical protein
MRNRNDPTERRMPWYRHELGDKDLHELVYAPTLALAKRGGRRQFLRTLNMIFMDEPLDTAVTWMTRDELARWNVVCSGIETLCARFAKTRPRSWAQPIDGPYKIRQHCKWLSNWLDGEKNRLDIYEKVEQMTLDAGVFGHGVLHPTILDGRPDIEVDWVGDHHVDPAEEENRCVLTRYRTKRVDRQMLIDKHPKAKAELLSAEDGLSDESSAEMAEMSRADLVLVVEGWRFTGPETGRYIKVASNVVLEHSTYDLRCAPFVDFPWSLAPRRYWGVGEAQRMMGMQSELNELTSIVNKAYGMMVPRICLDTTMGVTAEQIGNDVGELVAYVGNGTGVPPLQILTPPAISQDFLQRQKMLESAILEMRGIGVHSATSRAPQIEESGKARVIQQDIESSRHFATEKRLEQTFIKIDKQLVQIARELKKDGGKKVLVALGGRRVKSKVYFEDIELTEEDYVYALMPVANLSKNPTAKLTEVKELIALGAMTDPSDVREQFELPDPEAWNDVGLAPRRLAQMLIDKALDGEVVNAEPFMDLQYALAEGSAQLCLAKINGESDAAIDALADFIGHVQTLIIAAMPPPPPMPMPGMGGPPMAPDGAPPMPPTGGPPAMPGG